MLLSNIMAGKGFDDKKYKFTSIDDFANQTELQNILYCINLPVHELTAGAKTGFTSAYYSEIRAIFIDIDPVKSYKDALQGENADFDGWNEILEEEITRLKQWFERNYKKLPTIILGTGIGIHIILELDKPIKEEDINIDVVRSFVFIQKIIDTIISDKFEIDAQAFASNTSNFWSTNTTKKSKLPIPQKIVKYKSNNAEKGVKYISQTSCISVNDTVFGLSEMVLPDFAYLVDGMEFDKAVKNVNRREAILAVLDKLRSDKSYKKEYETDQKLITRCINPDHSDNNPSAVFFKDSGVLHCKGCGVSLAFPVVYKTLTGEELAITEAKLAKFQDLDKFLIKYASVKGGDVEYCFLLNGQEVWLSVTDWTDTKLTIWCSNNKVINFKAKLKNDVMDKVNTRCILKEVPFIQRHTIKITSELVVLGKEHCFVRSGDRWVVNNFFDVVDGLDFPNTEKTDGYKRLVYSKMNDINHPAFNINALSIVTNAIIMSDFEARYKLHPLMYIYGMKDTGKSSMVNLALSVITPNYQDLIAGATSLHTILQQLSNRDYLPVFVDEFMKFERIKDTVVQAFKDIATNGGKFVKGTINNKAMLEEYRLKASPILASEFRDGQIDPSFYQRCIEINLNDLPRVNGKKSIQFNELLDTDKTFMFYDLLAFISKSKGNFTEEEIIKEFKMFDSLEGKKRYCAFLQVISYKLTGAFFKSVGLNYDTMLQNIIFNYIDNECRQNSKDSRVSVIAEDIISAIIAISKYETPLIVNSIRMEFIENESNFIKFYTTRSFLMGKIVGFKFEHLLNEVAEKPRMMRMMSGRSVLATVGFNITVSEMATLLDTLLMHSENSPQTTERINNLISKMQQTLIISKSRWDILVGRTEEVIKQEPKEVKTKVVTGIFDKTLEGL